MSDVNTELVLKVLRPIWHTKTETRAGVRGRIERVVSAAKVRNLRTGENPAMWRSDLAVPARSKIAPAEHHPAMP